MEPGPHILLVDDDDDIRCTMSETLLSRGYAVSEAADGRAALELLRSRDFDLVLLDISLPDSNGLEVAEYLRTNNRPIKVIVVTGTAGLTNAIRGAANGVADYITKPFTLEYLMGSIEHALSKEAKAKAI